MPNMPILDLPVLALTAVILIWAGVSLVGWVFVVVWLQMARWWGK